MAKSYQTDRRWPGTTARSHGEPRSARSGCTRAPRPDPDPTDPLNRFLRTNESGVSVAQATLSGVLPPSCAPYLLAGWRAVKLQRWETS